MASSNGKSGKSVKHGKNGSNGKVHRRFAVRTSKIHGKGVFALTDIPKGTRLIEYVGRRIPEKLADEVYADVEGQPSHTFLFALDDGSVIDGTHGGNTSRWINHSCQPNCEAVGEDVAGKERIYIETIRNIKAGQELNYDYSFEFDEPHTPALKRRYPCYCGTRKCRSTILVKKR